MTVNVQREFQASAELSVASVLDVKIFMVNNRNKILKDEQANLNLAFT